MLPYFKHPLILPTKYTIFIHYIHLLYFCYHIFKHPLILPTKYTIFIHYIHLLYFCYHIFKHPLILPTKYTIFIHYIHLLCLCYHIVKRPLITPTKSEYLSITCIFYISATCFDVTFAIIRENVCVLDLKPHFVI